MTNKSFRNKYKGMVPNHINIEDVGKGWHQLICTVMTCIRFHVQRNKNLRPCVTELKEKFGLLRLQISLNDPYIRGLVAMAEAISEYTCEGCGVPGKHRKNGYHRVLCDKCEEEYQKDK